MRFEAANIVRRQQLTGRLRSDQAAQAHVDLIELTVEQWPYELLWERAWELREHLSSYDGSYVALAALTGAALVTLDKRIRAALGLRCTLATP